MQSRFNLPDHTPLTREQAETQVSKCQERLLEEYEEDYLFLSNPKTKGSSAVADFLRARSLEHTPDIYHLLRGLGTRAVGYPVHWVDVGGGRMLAQRELIHKYDSRDISLSTVDLFNHGLDGLPYVHQIEFEHLFTEPSPTLIQADARTVKLETQAHLITAIELFEYLDDPLATLANLYNQTAPGGIVAIGTAYDWSRSILRKATDGTVMRDDLSRMPATELLRAFREHGIAFAATREADAGPSQRSHLFDEAYQILTIEKRAGTRLVITQPALPPLLMPDGYKVQYYPMTTHHEPPLIQIIE
ncbi:MAG: methyltransferase domain-containing protein [Candidatus Saccharimonas sp.]